jgi:hypothetical protein
LFEAILFVIGLGCHSCRAREEYRLLIKLIVYIENISFIYVLT